ncbi:unnamed protein product [Notodromas monacha]|uniref:Uncharacterized protein n=1 Tax=Notodromas monacha TaxID=399045 RepID=A0A7R9BIL9_9CRUS|nr:unnamed protein product [Notodromas monacha]CAG0914779.1 unnamed protein product [Notodromas monacha]
MSDSEEEYNLLNRGINFPAANEDVISSAGTKEDASEPLLNPEFEKYLTPRCPRRSRHLQNKPRPPAFHLLPHCEVEMDPIVMHTISLREYARQMSAFLHGKEAGVPLDAADISEIPPYPPKMKDGKELCRNRRFPPPPLTESVAKQIFRKSVAAVAAHTGFYSSTEQVLDLLTDVAHEHLKSMLGKMRQMDEKSRCHVYPAVHPCVLVNVANSLGDNPSGHDTISNWYRNSVKRKLLEMEDYCETLREKCNKIFPEPGYKRCRRLPTQLMCNVPEMHESPKELEWIMQPNGEETIRSGNSWNNSGDSETEIPLASALGMIEDNASWSPSETALIPESLLRQAVQIKSLASGNVSVDGEENMSSKMLGVALRVVASDLARMGIRRVSAAPSQLSARNLLRPLLNGELRLAYSTKGPTYVELPKKRGKAGEGKGPVNWRTLGIFAAFGSVFVAVVMYLRSEKDKAIQRERKRELGKAKIGGSFQLVDHFGNPRKSSDFHGKWCLIYFGFTHCPDICPDELEKLGKIVDTLAASEHADPVQPLFVSVDPERDTVPAVRAYVKEFHPALLGLTGTVEQVKEACKAYRVYFSAGPRDDDDDYIIMAKGVRDRHAHANVVYEINQIAEMLKSVRISQVFPVMCLFFMGISAQIYGPNPAVGLPQLLNPVMMTAVPRYYSPVVANPVQNVRNPLQDVASGSTYLGLLDDPSGGRGKLVNVKVHDLKSNEIVPLVHNSLQGALTNLVDLISDKVEQQKLSEVLDTAAQYVHLKRLLLGGDQQSPDLINKIAALLMENMSPDVSKQRTAAMLNETIKVLENRDNFSFREPLMNKPLQPKVDGLNRSPGIETVMDSELPDDLNAGQHQDNVALPAAALNSHPVDNNNNNKCHSEQEALIPPLPLVEDNQQQRDYGDQP